jgi:hypothetical protein
MSRILQIAFLCFLYSTAASAQQDHSRTLAASDDAELETALIPIFIRSAPGAHGSIWQTRLAVTSTSAETILLSYFHASCEHISPCIAGIELVDGRVVTEDDLLPPQRFRDGIFVRYPRHLSHEIHFNLRVQDLSRQSQTWGTEIAVVRESQALTRPATLLSVPIASSFRQALRIYGFGRNEGLVDLEIRSQANGALLWSGRAHLPAVDFQPQLAQYLDLAALLPANYAGQVRIELEPVTPELRYWAFVSVTNNETQHVTTITPQ